jgi:hypothetical protein
VIVLGEADVPAHSLVEARLVVAFHEEAAIVSKELGLEDQNVRQVRRRDEHNQSFVAEQALARLGANGWSAAMDKRVQLQAFS